MPLENCANKGTAQLFSRLSKWINKQEAFTNVPTGWKVSLIGDLVERVTTRETVLADKFYELAGIRLYGNGIYHRETVLGAECSSPYLYPLAENVFVYNRLFAWRGTFDVVSAKNRHLYVSNEFPRYTVNGHELLPQYLFLYCLTQGVQKEILAASAGSAAVSRNRLKETEFEHIKIIYPGLEIQHMLVDAWQKTHHQMVAEQLELQSETSCLEQIFFDKIGVENIAEDTVRRKSFATRFSGLSHWGVYFNQSSWTLEDLLDSKRFPMVRLGDIAGINPQSLPLCREDALTFVPMNAVSEYSGRIEEPSVCEYKDVSSGYTRFMEGDVIWAKITPCMQNGKCAVAKDLYNFQGAGSTEFHVIRPHNADIVLPEYIWAILRTKKIRNAAQRFFIGSAGQQRVPASFLEELYIPLPPIDFQKKVIAEYLKVNMRIAEKRSHIIKRKAEIRSQFDRILLGNLAELDHFMLRAKQNKQEIASGHF